ncbi:MAG TPA: MFS transporter [Nitrososphaerales archaeon]|nr:MFS transporter [Nitrososphaerales archaeon]
MNARLSPNTRRYVAGFFLVPSFSGLVASQVFSILLPLIAYNYGASALEVGVVGGVANGVYVIFAAMMGRISGEERRRRLLVITSLFVLMVLSILYFSYSNNVAQLIGLRVVEGVGFSMFWPIIQSGIGKLDYLSSVKVLGMYNVSWSAGSVIGPLIVTIASIFTGMQFSFEVTAVLLGGTIVIALITTRNGVVGGGRIEEAVQDKSEPVREKADITETDSSPASPSKRKGSKEVLSLMMFTVLCASSMGVLFTFFPPYAGSLGFPLATVGFAIMAYGATRFLSYLVLSVGRIRQKLVVNESHRLVRLFCGCALISAATALIGIVANAMVLYFGAFIAVAAGFTLVYSVSQSAMISESGASQSSSLAGLFESALGLGLAGGPILGGVLSTAGLSFAFLVPSFELVAISLTLALSYFL